VSGLGRALAVSVLLHLVPLLAVQWQRSEPRPWRPRQLPITLDLRDEPPQRPTVDDPTPDPDLPPRQVEVRRRRTIHEPARRPRAPAASPYPDPYPAEPEVTAKPPSFAPDYSPLVVVPQHPVVEALSRSTLAGARIIDAPDGTVRCYFLQAGESASQVVTTEGLPLVLVSSDDTLPAGGGVDWNEAGDAAWLNKPEAVRSWWSLWGTVAPRVGRQDGQVVAVWLPSSVRAGWEVRSEGALGLWDNLVSAPELSGLLAEG